MKTKPNLPFWSLWNLSFGFFGVQIAYALQSANISRIFATLGADPHNLSYFWILPPLMGILVQPIVGTLSDKTWTRWGRRIPYLFVGAAVAVAVMCLLPNSGSFGLAVSAAMIFGLIALMFLDTSINMAMQPFKMLVGDMVNEEQKAKAYSIQSFLCNAGSVVGFVFPFVLTWIGIKNVAEKGVIPDSVIWSFYLGAAILILCVIYTTLKVKEWNPQEYAEYNPVSEEKEDSANWITLLKNAPSTFWKVGLVQFFCWAAFLYMWNYTTGAIAEVVWDTTDPVSEPFQEAGNWVGILFAVQAMGSVVWATILPQFKNTKLRHQPCYWWHWLCDGSLPARPVSAVHPVPLHWLCMGGYAGYAVHLRHQCLAGLWSHGCLSGTLQRYHLYSSDCCSPLWWSRLVTGRPSPVHHDDCLWRSAGDWRPLCYCYQE